MDFNSEDNGRDERKIKNYCSKKKRICEYHGERNVPIHRERSELHEVYQLYATAVMNSNENRATFLEYLVTARAKAGQTKAAVELKMTRRLEKVKASWNRIHRMDGTGRKAGGLQRIIASNIDGKWTEKVIKEEVKKGTLQENERRFT